MADFMVTCSVCQSLFLAAIFNTEMTLVTGMLLSGARYFRNVNVTVLLHYLANNVVQVQGMESGACRRKICFQNVQSS